MSTCVINEYSPSLVVLQVGFRGASETLVNVTNPLVRITKGFEGTPVKVDSLGSVINSDLTYPLSPLSPPVTGTYKFSFLTTGLKPGLLTLDFSGEITDADNIVHTRHIPGLLEIGPLTHLDDLINRVQIGLMDDCPDLYRLDEPVHQWGRDQIFTFLRDALDWFNSAGPRQTAFSFDTLPPTLDGLLVQGAKVWALWARARLEKANEMNYSDVHTLNIQRAEFYKSLADTWFEAWKQQIQDFKRSTPPKPIGVRSQRLPFRIFRVIGMLPNYSSYFSG